MSDNPFGVLGLPARADLADDDVRAAWRRLAAATHPDRPDGGDPDRFAAAAAAYTTLRTRSGRGEALADLAGPGRAPRRARPAGPAPPAAPGPRTAAPRTATPRTATPRTATPGTATAVAAGPVRRWAGRLAARIRRGRPARLLLRIAIAAAVSAATVAVAGAQPATPAVIVGAATWLLLTARRDLAPPPR
ncbi:MAG TPA: hypothetical protein VMH35_09805 [Streptosporangiaceae bacterium]|nr:hypothetical protein [Streptosporangiaceae bacterium]